MADVIISHSYDDDVETVTALDLQGRELWSREQEQGIIVGSRLYLASRATTSEEFGYSELRQVVPRTGWPVNHDVYEEPFFYAMEATPGQLALVQNDSIRLLDEHLRPQPVISVLEERGIFHGRKWFYLANKRSGGSSATHIRLSAIDPSGARTLWSLDLDPGQSVDQMGRHLVVINADDETIHGLKS